MRAHLARLLRRVADWIDPRRETLYRFDAFLDAFVEDGLLGDEGEPREIRTRVIKRHWLFSR